MNYEHELLHKVRKSWLGKGSTGQFRFHDICGSNISINHDKTVAYRERGFSHGLCFSHCPLLPGQIFLIEITDAQDGWSGNLRIGVTQHDPSTLHPMPEMVIPDMTSGGRTEHDGEIRKLGQTWARAVTKFHNRIPGRFKEVIGWPNDDANMENKMPNCAFFVNQRVLVKDMYFLARKELTFTSTGIRFPDFGQSVFIGSRIGLTLVPVNDETGIELGSPEEELCISEHYRYSHCNMHLIINGEDQGPCETRIPLDRPLYVIIDVYSTTKQIRIIPTSHIGTLKDLARDTIRNIVPEDVCSKLPLPVTMKEFCRFE